MEIPVYGLSGIDNGKHRFKRAAKRDGKPFKQFADMIKNPAVKNMIVAKHRKKIAALEGIYNFNAAKVKNGNATRRDRAELKKAKILLTLEATDYDAFRLASIYMPYVSDIDDNDGGYYFTNPEVAQIAAAGEEEFVAYLNSPAPTELGKLKIFKKIGNAFKKATKAVGKAVKTVAKATAKATKAVAKATANTVKAAAKSTVNAVKATANLTKAAAQAVTGKGAKAKETLKKAASQVKAAAVQPIKQAAKDTKNVVKDTAKATAAIVKATVVDPLKQTIKIAGKIFKVLFIKINPLTIMIRSSLRGLMALNFCGMATRLAVGFMTQSEAEAEGYSKESWEKAKKALEKFKKLFKKMGGNEDKLVKSIKNGAKKKPLFKKDINKNTKVNFASGDQGETTLQGDPATIIAMIAACIGILTTIWSWVSSIVAQKKQQKAQKKQEEEQKRLQEEAQRQAEEEQKQYEAQQQLALQQAAEAQAAAQAQAEEEAAAKKERNKKLIKWALIGGAVIGIGYLVTRSK